MSINGFATTEGTVNYRTRFESLAAANHFRVEQNLWLSSIGLGTYLGNWDEATDQSYTEAIVRAVELGCNVIDTAANYRFQRSERSIGKALVRLIETGKANRDEILICTKGGYLPFDGAPPADVRAYIEETFVKTGIATFEDIVDGSHCMTPRYLQSQIDQSLQNMNLETIDVYYIHNPESQLSSVTLGEFEMRLRTAFERLEQNIADGKIKHYGVATWNGFRAQPKSHSIHSLERMSVIANEVGGSENGFRFIQLPFNLAMTEALSVNNQLLDGEYVSTLEAANKLDITAVASASLLQGKVANGLPQNVREILGSLPTDALTAIQFVRSTFGFSTALIGMSSREHVEENLKLVQVEPVSMENYQRLFTK